MNQNFYFIKKRLYGFLVEKMKSISKNKKQELMFNSVELFSRWLSNGSNELAFSSVPKKLSWWKVFLFSLASGDFNPAHCQQEFASQSFFKDMVSQGIAILARAEGEFVKLFPKFFNCAFEIIARGHQDNKFHSPLFIGEIYQYDFKISKGMLVEGRCNFECQIVCRVVCNDARLISETIWKPAIVEHVGEVAANFLKPKSYWHNVFNILLWQPVKNYSLAFLFILVMLIALAHSVLYNVGVVHLSSEEIKYFLNAYC
ncbi:MAG: MaoC/PaaZ C-terminal domain-containing protein [Candidatus Kapabacteria bacterium]|nr:MaoC/PaaZ C-terminal domain-containing protein [Candidatus Kapabacteria bacterium]